MAKSSQTFQKRQRENKLREKAQQKRERRQQRQSEKKQAQAREAGLNGTPVIRAEVESEAGDEPDVAPGD
jgi:hypothetical protein